MNVRDHIFLILKPDIQSDIHFGTCFFYQPEDGKDLVKNDGRSGNILPTIVGQNIFYGLFQDRFARFCKDEFFLFQDLFPHHIFGRIHSERIRRKVLVAFEIIIGKFDKNQS